MSVTLPSRLTLSLIPISSSPWEPSDLPTSAFLTRLRVVAPLRNWLPVASPELAMGPGAQGPHELQAGQLALC